MAKFLFPIIFILIALTPGCSKGDFSPSEALIWALGTGDN